MQKTPWLKLLSDLQSSDQKRYLRAIKLFDETASKENVSDLYELLKSDNQLFREVASIPLTRLEGVVALPAFLEAVCRGEKEGHDNDTLVGSITSLITQDREAVKKNLKTVLQSNNPEMKSVASWALDFASANETTY